MFVISLLIIVFIIFSVIWYIFTPKKLNINGSHIFITGGSSGIGKSLAEVAVKKGAKVTLIARNKNKLDKTVKDLMVYADGSECKVHAISCDVSGSYGDIVSAVKEAEGKFGPINVLINCAGISSAGRFEDVPLEDYSKLMTVNYLGSVYVTRAVVDSMKKQKQGRIVFVSSQAGQLGVFGYCPYSPTKFALKGLAEALQMEVAPYNIRVTVSFPPDTETPGFREEMNSGTKPKECLLISETSGIFNPDDVANRMMEDMVVGKFQSWIGLDGWMLSVITAGMCPVTSVREFIEQVFLSGVLRLISVFYLLSFDAIVRKCKNERESVPSKKEN